MRLPYCADIDSDDFDPHPRGHPSVWGRLAKSVALCLVTTTILAGVTCVLLGFATFWFPDEVGVLVHSFRGHSWTGERRSTPVVHNWDSADAAAAVEGP
jgi:hypothetical protein